MVLPRPTASASSIALRRDGQPPAWVRVGAGGYRCWHGPRARLPRLALTQNRGAQRGIRAPRNGANPAGVASGTGRSNGASRIIGPRPGRWMTCRGSRWSSAVGADHLGPQEPRASARQDESTGRIAVCRNCHLHGRGWQKLLPVARGRGVSSEFRRRPRNGGFLRKGRAILGPGAGTRVRIRIREKRHATPIHHDRFAAGRHARVAPPVWAQGPAAFTVDEMLKLKRVSDPQLSPDGTKIAFCHGREPRQNTAQRHLDRAGGRRLRSKCRHGRSEDRPRWSPDGRQLAFVSNREAVRRSG